MNKQNFYDFAIMMANDSKLLFEANRLHNSVYLGGYVLEAYIKIILIDKNSNYYGHINDKDNKFLKKLERIKSTNPELFEDSILNQNNDNYPSNILSQEYNINYRYEIERWIDEEFCQNVQNEINSIKMALNELERQGIM